MIRFLKRFCQRAVNVETPKVYPYYIRLGDSNSVKRIFINEADALDAQDKGLIDYYICSYNADSPFTFSYSGYKHNCKFIRIKAKMKGKEFGF